MFVFCFKWHFVCASAFDLPACLLPSAGCVLGLLGTVLLLLHVFHVFFPLFAAFTYKILVISCRYAIAVNTTCSVSVFLSLTYGLSLERKSCFCHWAARASHNNNKLRIAFTTNAQSARRSNFWCLNCFALLYCHTQTHTFILIWRIICL